MNVANEWKDYEILDMADGQKLERWGNIKLFGRIKVFQGNGIMQMQNIIEAQLEVEVGNTIKKYQKIGK